MFKLLAGLSSILALLTAPTAAAAQTEVHFSVPSINGTVDTSLEDKLIELIDSAAPGSSIRLATYVLQRPVIKDAIVEAAQVRNVDVEVVAEGNGHNPLLDQLATALGPGRVTLCQDACNNQPGQVDVMHHKFAVFSQLADGRTDVVMQSSANLSSDFGLHNNMLISSGDAGLADGYRSVFATLKSQAAKTWTTPFTSDSGKITVWMTPRATDPLLDAITDVQCPGTIRIVHSQFATDRLPVIDMLGTKKKAGCTVQVIVPEGNQTVLTAQLLAAYGIPVYTFRPGGCHEPVEPSLPGLAKCGVDSIHSKILLTDGPSTAAGGAVKRYVYAGSHNLNNGSLKRSDDSIVRIDDAAIYAQYDANYLTLLDKVFRFVPSAYPNGASQVVAGGARDQQPLRAAAELNGYTAVTWESASQIFARIYRYGQPVTAAARIDMGGVGCTTGWNHVQPSVGVDDQGNAYVAWAEDGDCRGEHNIAVRRLTTGGQLSAAIWANGPLWAGDQARPRIAVTGAGAFTVVWEDAPTATVRASGYSSLTARTFGPIQVSAGNRPDVAVDGAGVATVVWQQAPSVYGKRISATGTTTAGPTKINSTNNNGEQHLAPAVATTAAGTVVVAWSNNLEGWRIRVRGFTSGLAERFTERAVVKGAFKPGQLDDGGASEYPPLCDEDACALQGQPSIAAASDGRFVVGWNSTDNWNYRRSNEVYAKGFNANGTTGGTFPALRMNPNTVGTQYATAVSAGPSGFTYFYVDDYDVNGVGDIVARTGFTNTGF